MNKYIFLNFFVLLFFVLTAQSENHKNLCVQTLNTYGMFYSVDVDERHSQILQFLRENSCDVILLQEVWYDNHQANLEQLSDDLEMSDVHFDSDDRKSGLMGLVRGTVGNSMMEYFPNSSNGIVEDILGYLNNINKGFGMLHVEYPEFPGQPFYIINVHFDHFSQRRRLQSLLFHLRWIINNVEDHSPMIIAGDFNFEPDGLEFDIVKYMFRFIDPYEKMKKERHCTYSCKDSGYNVRSFFLGDRVLDHIFFKPSSNMVITPQDIEVFPRQYNGKSLSDHYGVRALLNIEEKHDVSDVQLEPEEFQNRVSQFTRVLNEVEKFLLEDNENISAFDQQHIQFFRTGLSNSNSLVSTYLSM